MNIYFLGLKIPLLWFIIGCFLLYLLGIIIHRKIIYAQMKKYGVESPAELKLYKAFKKLNISVTPQYPVDGYRVDFAWFTDDGLKIAIECNGEEFHSKIEDKIWDREKDNYLRKKGWKVFRIPAWKIFKNPHQCIYQLFEYKKGWSRVKEFRDYQKQTYEIQNRENNSQYKL